MNLLEMNISVSLMIVIVLLIRTIGKKYISKTVIVLLWNLILVRALLPFQIPVENIPLFQQFSHKWEASELTSQAFPVQFDRYMLGEASANILGETDKISGNLQLEKVLLGLWLAGAVCLFINFVRVYKKEYRVLRKCVPVQNDTAERLIRSAMLHRKVRLFEGEDLISPVTYGIWYPKIVIPQELYDISRVDMRNMVAHELVHIRRNDVAKRFMMIAVLCIHWFNPLTWAMYHCYLEDQEMACDERVLRKMDGDESKSYVYTMIKMASGGSSLWSTTGFMRQSAEKRRILEAMNQKRMGIGSILISLVLCLCLGVSLFSFTQVSEVSDMKAFSVQRENETPQLQKLEAVKKEQPLLSPVYEGEIRSFSTENFDYEAVMQDIIDNYNDFSQPLTEEQVKAIRIKNLIIMADMYKSRQDQGEKLKPRELWILDEFYEYGK